MNGLSAQTAIDGYTTHFPMGKEEWHRHPETGETIVLETRYVDGGDGDVIPESEVIEVIPRGGLLGELVRLCQA